MITYKKMSLFDAPEGSFLAHGCNAQGVWGSGIAAPFKEKYPRSFKEYSSRCDLERVMNKKYGAVGMSYLCAQENKRNVLCLITSFDYGPKRDRPDVILTQTHMALGQLCKDLAANGLLDKPIYSNKFNSGMFRVDWQYTEKILNYYVERYGLTWIVCDPDME